MTDHRGRPPARAAPSMGRLVADLERATVAISREHGYWPRRASRRDGLG
jgi:hypothetical protein